jgi:hypothetical protein
VRWLSIFLCVLAMSGCTASSAASCGAGEVERRGAAVRDARARLAAIPLSDGESLVPPPVRAAIEALKDRLSDYVAAAVACAPAGEASERLGRRLAEQGDAVEDRRALVAAGDFPDGHGADLAYDVAVPPGHPNLLAVVARFGINCGEDGMFFLFERSGSGYRPLIVRRSDPYDEISGAWEGLRYALSPPGSGGRWYVAIAHTPPWCQSVWRGLTYDLARPSGDPSRPDIFFRTSVGNNIDNNVPLALRAEPDRFQVEHDGGILDPDINKRRHVETYAITGDRIRRIQPVAFNVRDFVEEWLRVPWAEAQHWSAPAPDLADSHRALVASIRLENSYYEFGAIRRCERGLHQITLTAVPLDHGSFVETWYVFVSGDGPFRVERASRTPSAACTGHDLGAAIERESRRRMGLEPIS